MNALIVEDEARIAKRVERMTRDILGDKLQKLHVCNTLQEAQVFIETDTLDLVLLDLNLNGADGFELLTKAVAKSFHTIIISAYKEQAIKAFEYGVLDFVPKPFNQERLQQALNRALSEGSTNIQQIKYLAVKIRSNIKLVPIEDVVYIKGAGVYSELHLNDGSTALHDKSLERLQQLLGEGYERIHKSYLLKMSELQEITVSAGSQYKAVLKNGGTIPIGRTRYKEVRDKWG